MSVNQVQKKKNFLGTFLYFCKKIYVIHQISISQIIWWQKVQYV